MTVEVARFTADPAHGRPRVAQFAGVNGKINVHCERSTGALWLFADGPRGGSRGIVVVAVARAGELLAWLDGDRSRSFFGRDYLQIAAVPEDALSEAGDRIVTIRKRSAWSEGLRMRFDAEAAEEFELCLREWATAAVAVRDAPDAPPRTEKIRLGIAGRQVVFELTRDGTDAWRVQHGDALIGSAYKLTGGRWKARPVGRPSGGVEHETRAKAIVALFERVQ